MRAVAERAEVSHQTVSRVLNGHPHVSIQVRRRVEEAIEALGYRPNAAARSLVTRKSRTVGVLISELSEYGPSQMLLGFEQAAREAGYFISIASVQDISITDLQASLAHLGTQGVEGIAVILPHADAIAAITGVTPSVPVVMAGSPRPEFMSAALFDQRSGARKAVKHLIDLGHTRIGHVAGPLDWYDAWERFEGWREALLSSGLATDLLFTGDWTAEHGYDAGLQIVDHPGLSAVFAANDQIALGVLRGVRESGLDVPQDISIVGYDDQPCAAYLSPPLTSVRLDFKEQGRRCSELLTSYIEGRTTAMPPTVQPELVVRHSTCRIGEPF